ncbi:hypothetical protein L1987_11441 [Smallanthus sonchifolius]|uniref:Uncharacterized protein n=1 Tax=Smallanthus sonchifolius TaxID=185202 RepID=A0ACB9JD18_9ASTR|nr:hypothetical protein L1987_11441 [Smallanthus sonchifolius]
MVAMVLMKTMKKPYIKNDICNRWLCKGDGSTIEEKQESKGNRFDLRDADLIYKEKNTTSEIKKGIIWIEKLNQRRAMEAEEGRKGGLE